MKVYTKKGDKGFSSILGGEKSSKSDVVFEVLGSIDELNACLGVVVSFCNNNSVKNVIKKIQNDLFVLGSDVASVNNTKEAFPKIAEKHVVSVEKVIDAVLSGLSVQKNFIIPGGSSSSSFLHLSRSICRRLERRFVDFSKVEKSLNPVCLSYVNRLSDLFFVLAREENKNFDEVGPDYTLN